uniref:GTP cyclohydrolase I n=1 Tax=viral metagenome TaxID=1070528 RepID=A0A6M3ILW0_9ZZZZ
MDNIMLIKNILSLIGENPGRPGLLDTPKRTLESWKFLFSGYAKDPKEIFTTFDSEGYDEIICLKNCEFFSMCEHHLLPFFGKAHIAYIPKKGGSIIGISKLARLMEIYSRRLQIQERLGNQIVQDLMKYLQCKGAACIIEASHLCMRMRGVEKQNSIMVTSSLKGVFLEQTKKGHAARNELMQLIKL